MKQKGREFPQSFKERRVTSRKEEYKMHDLEKINTIPSSLAS
jgi:hypothetical protein